MENDNNQIDFVVLWVDGNDENWIQVKNQYSNTSKKGYADSNIRYRDWGLFRFWFRGIEKFAPWVNKVHLVTWGHVPSWLNQNHPKLNIVNHHDFIPEKYLPTFNSSVIELNVHRISGLAEKFVFFNDDFFLANNVNEKDFFYRDKPCDELVFNTIVQKDYSDIFAHFLLNNVSILNMNFSKRRQFIKYPFKHINLKYGAGLFRNLLLLPWSRYTGFKNRHLPQPFLKKTFEIVWNKEGKYLNEICHNKFRNRMDFTQYLIREWQLVSGKFSPINKNSQGKYFDLGEDNSKAINAIKNQRIKMICLNDSVEVKDFDQRKDELTKAFNFILPEKSTYEIN